MEAYLYQALKGHKIRCDLCHHRCLVKEGQRGLCGVRENKAGTLKTRVYGKLIARHIDPIEKKPLYHFHPGSRSYSIATVGCNFKCLFCQNAEIAQMPSDHNGQIMGTACSPEEIVADALRNRCQSISYTYTEPTIYFELAFDTAKLARQKGLGNVFVTNGYMTAEAIEKITPYLDAANVDLKAFSGDFYREYCNARLEPVKDTLMRMKKLGIFVEVTTLIIPGLNDSPAELTALAGFLAAELGPETPWHISRFHPTYKLTDRPVTPVATLTQARKIGLSAGLRYVYTGNVPGDTGENTFCHACGQRLIERIGFHVRQNEIENGKCKFCGVTIDGIGM
jgi:pyruvate formate lyase activating enzyme